MITFDPGAGEPTQWAVCFTRKAASKWAAWLPGTYKHVRAFGFVGPINTWVFFDPALSRTTIRVARGEAASQLIHEFLYAAAVIEVPTRARTGTPPIFGWCAPAVAHLLGVSGGALRPDTLFAHCLRQGGLLLADGCTVATAAAAA
jgi:hypothetical protein